MLRKLCYAGLALSALNPALAQTDPGAADRAFAQCGSIADSTARLACYDSARSTRPPQAAAPPAGDNGPAHYPEFSSPAQSAAKPLPAPGFTSNPLGSSARGGKLTAAIASYSLSPSGRFTIVLDNGEVWRQVDADDGVAQFKSKGRNMVVISKGFLWSYDLRLNAMSAIFKVTRVK